MEKDLKNLKINSKKQIKLIILPSVVMYTENPGTLEMAPKVPESFSAT